MSTWLLIGVALVYAFVAVQMMLKGAWPEALMFVGWAIGGVGSVLLAMRVG
jgi:hypothetical protein